MLCPSNVRSAAAAIFVLVIDYILGFVSSTLEPRTQLALRHAMVQRVLASDRPGYIYALELAGGCCGDIISGHVYTCRLFLLRRFQARPHPNQSGVVRERPPTPVTASQTMPVVQAQVAWAVP